MFADCEQFNQRMNRWDVNSVKDMGSMFYNCIHFNQELGTWKTIQCTDFTKMFRGCIRFSKSLEAWEIYYNVSNYHMFEFIYPDEWKPRKIETPIAPREPLCRKLVL